MNDTAGWRSVTEMLSSSFDLSQTDVLSYNVIFLVNFCLTAGTLFVSAFSVRGFNAFLGRFRMLKE